MTPSFETLFQEHFAYVWRVLKGLGIATADLDDGCQQVFMVVHRKLSAFEGRSSLKTWIYGICIRVAAEYRRKPYRQREEALEQSHVRSLPSVPPSASTHAEANDVLEKLLAALSPMHREIFVLFEMECLSTKEIGEVLDCPLQTVYSRINATQAAVRKWANQKRQEEQTNPGENVL